MERWEKWNTMQPVQKYKIIFFNLEIRQLCISKEKENLYKTLYNERSHFNNKKYMDENKDECLPKQ